MAKDNPVSLKHHHQLDAKRKRLTWILGVSGLCIISYVLGAWQNTTPPTIHSEVYNRVGCDDSTPAAAAANTNISTVLDFETHHQIEVKQNEKTSQFPPCNIPFMDYTPCEYPPRSRKFDRTMLKYRERHCPNKEELFHCLIPAPPKIKTPLKWPQSRDFAWYYNIPHIKLSIEKAVQNWIKLEGDRFRFPGGGTTFPKGAETYIEEMSCKLGCIPAEIWPCLLLHETHMKHRYNLLWRGEFLL